MPIQNEIVRKYILGKYGIQDPNDLGRYEGKGDNDRKRGMMRAELQQQDKDLEELISQDPPPSPMPNPIGQKPSLDYELPAIDLENIPKDPDKEYLPNMSAEKMQTRLPSGDYVTPRPRPTGELFEDIIGSILGEIKPGPDRSPAIVERSDRGPAFNPSDNPMMDKHFQGQEHLDFLSGFGEDKRKELESKFQASGSPWWAALSGVGAAIKGGDVGKAFGDTYDLSQYKDKKALEDFYKGRGHALTAAALKRRTDPTSGGFDTDAAKMLAEKRNPNSSRSKNAREMVVGIFKVDPKLVEGKTAEELEGYLPYLSKKLDLDARKSVGESKPQGLTPYQMAMINRRDDDSAYRKRKDQEEKERKQKESDEKKKKSVTEIEDRRRNIEDNLTTLESMIKEDGTFEMFGPHNQNMERLVEIIATDMAKLADPDSVARPSEVEAFKKGLIKPGFTNTNSTAESILKSFRNEINQRVKNAYDLRGLENPGTAAERKNSEPPKYSVKDKAAFDWATKNSKDPDAQKILEKLKAKYGN